MKSVLVAAAAALFLMPAVALAQGPMPMLRTGAYAGLNGGVVAGSSSFDLYDWECCDSGTFSGSNVGAIGGVQGGFNWIANNFLLGVEGDAQLTSYSVQLPDTPYGDASVGQKADTLATLRVRIGALLNERTAIYATGGLAVTNGNVTLHDETGHTADTDNMTASGFAFGAGVEKTLTDTLSGKIEALVVQTKGNAHTYFDDEGEEYYAHVTFNALILRAGVNAHF
jgi:outer membrane immunogenic protein